MVNHFKPHLVNLVRIESFLLKQVASKFLNIKENFPRVNREFTQLNPKIILPTIGFNEYRSNQTPKSLTKLVNILCLNYVNSELLLNTIIYHL